MSEKTKSDIRIFGHRGTRGFKNPPENSLAAFEAAINQGANGIELDVYLSDYGQKLIFQDTTLKRMTGVNQRTIASLTPEERESPRFFLRNAKGEATDQKIPTYAEVLDLVERKRLEAQGTEDEERMNNFIVNTEIKALPGKDTPKSVAEEMWQRLEGSWEPKNFQVSSFDMDSLRRMKDLLPKIPRGALMQGGGTATVHVPIDFKSFKRQFDAIKDIEPATINIMLPSLMKDLRILETIRASGARPVTWIVDEGNPNLIPPDSQKEVSRFLEFCGKGGIDVITGWPKQMREMLSQGQEQSRRVS